MEHTIQTDVGNRTVKVTHNQKDGYTVTVTNTTTEEVLSITKIENKDIFAYVIVAGIDEAQKEGLL